MRRTASEVLRNLEMRIARLERQAKASVEKSTFSIGGEKAITGKEILELNEYDPEVMEALEEALKNGKYDGYHMEDVKLVKKK
jgi:translation elongation factor EF-G